jgi:hypothetical protein
VSYGQVRELVIPLACGFATLVKESRYSPSGDGAQFIGIAASNRTEWYLTDLACVLARITSVGLQHLWPLSDLEHVCNITKLTVCAQCFASTRSTQRLCFFVQCIVCSPEMAVKFSSDEFLLHVPFLRTLIVMDGVPPSPSLRLSASTAATFTTANVRLLYLSELCDAKRYLSAALKQYPTQPPDAVASAALRTGSGVGLFDPEPVDEADDQADFKVNGSLYGKGVDASPPVPKAKAAAPAVAAATAADSKSTSGSATASPDFLFTLIFTSGRCAVLCPLCPHLLTLILIFALWV